MYVRSKKDGDSVFYGGCTHKLKKMYNDKKIPPSKRPLIPVLADEKGVVWVPCCGVRDDCTEETRDRLYVAIGIGKSESLQDVRVMLPSEFDIY